MTILSKQREIQNVAPKTSSDVTQKPIEIQSDAKEIKAGTSNDTQGIQSTPIESTKTERAKTTWTPTPVVYNPSGVVDAQEAAEAANGTQKKRTTYTEILERLSPYKKETPEEQKKENKRRRREAIIAAIGDGISSLANIYFAGKGAPNMPRPSLSKTYKERWDKIDATRTSNDLAYKQAILRAAEMDKAADDADVANRRKQRVDDVKWQWQREYDEAVQAQKQANIKVDRELRERNAIADRKLKEDIAAANRANSTRNAQIRANGSKSRNNNTNTIALNNGRGTEVVSYNKNNAGALRSIVPKMLAKADQLGKLKWSGAAAYRSIAQKIRKSMTDAQANAQSPEIMMEIINEHAADFPQLYYDFRKVLGLESTRASVTKPSSSTQARKAKQPSGTSSKSTKPYSGLKI